MKMYAKEGNVMMDVKALSRDGDNLAVKGKMMEAMTMTIFLRPEDLWGSLKLLSWPVFCYLPVMMIKGWWRSLKASGKEKRHQR